MKKSIKEQPTILIIKNQGQSAQISPVNGEHSPAVKGKLFAQWLLDKHSKLYCQWKIRL